MRRTKKNQISKQRQALFFIIAGTNGTGKTTLLKKLIQQNGKRTLIIDPDGYEFSDVATIEIGDITRIKNGKKARIVAPTNKDLENLINFTDGNLVLDDCRYYIKSRIEESIRRLFVRRRQHSIDIFAVAHSLNEVPPTFWTFATHLILFKTKDSSDRLKQNFPRYEEVLKQNVKEINSHKNHHYFRIIPL